MTVDLDIVYRRTAENITRLAASLEPLNPYLRGAPAGLPFQFAGRPRDLERIAELEALLDEKRGA